MVFKRGLNLHIKVEGLGSGHYNACVNFKLRHHVVPKTNSYCMGNMQVLPIMANTNNS
jgi:hypothetical protein